MRIGLDVRYLSHGLVGGIHTYLENFIPALMNESSSHEVFLYADTKRPFELGSLPPHVTLRLLPYRNQLSSSYLDLFMWRWMINDKVDLVHFTGNYGFAPASLPTVMTLQDEINILPWVRITKGHKKNFHTITMMTYLHLCTSYAIRRANHVITISDYSKKQILKYSRLSPEKITIVPHACPKDIRLVSDPGIIAEVNNRLGLSKPFILAEAFKNPDVIVRAWRQLPDYIRNSHEIIFFSRSPAVLPVVNEAVAQGWARLFIRPSRSDLSVLYSECLAFVFPSWIEGFGIPLVEAMTCGAPIIASDRGSIPEVVENAGWIMDAEDDLALRNYLVKLIECPGERDLLRERGFSRVRAFSWSDIAKKTLELYSSLLTGNGREMILVN